MYPELSNLQNEEQTVAEKILRDLSKIIYHNSNIKEFSIIPVSGHRNKSPIILEEECLGLESWCVTYIYSHAYNKLFEIRKLHKKKYLTSSVILRDVNCFLTGTLLINPDVSSFWNMRRELVLRKRLPIEGEFHLTKLVLTNKSKSNETFAYRRWLLTNQQSLSDSQNAIEPIVQREFDICTFTAEKCLSNYHSWTHRIWVMNNAADENLLSTELQYTENWISNHVSEHTGFHYRQVIFNLIPKYKMVLDNKYYESVKNVARLENMAYCSIKDTANYLFNGLVCEVLISDSFDSLINYLSVLLYELKTVTELNNIFIEHESIWYHRRYTLYELFSLLVVVYETLQSGSSNVDWRPKEHFTLKNKPDVFCDSRTKSLLENGEKSPKILKSNHCKLEFCPIYNVLVENEKNFLQTAVTQSAKQKDFSCKHKHWLKIAIGLNM